MANPKGPFLGPTLTIISINIEGITKNKQDLLSQLCQTTNCDILCIQETHRSENSNRPAIPGMNLSIEIPHAKHGSAIFTKPRLAITSVGKRNDNGIEVLTVEAGKYTVTSIYKPPGVDFSLPETDNLRSQKTRFIIGDFNSHNITWGYDTTDSNGELVEEWADLNNLTLIHDPKLPFSFTSKVWKRGYNPDLSFVTSNIEQQCTKVVYNALPKTQHRPIGINMYHAAKAPTVPFKRRFNFKKAKWENFTKDLNREINSIEPLPNNYEHLIELVKRISRQHIPRGCRQQYIPGVSTDIKDLMSAYNELYEKDPFGEDTIECGAVLLIKLGEARQQKWLETLEKMDMTHSSKMAWNTIKKLSGDPLEPKQSTNVTPNQVAQQLLLNGKVQKKQKFRKLTRDINDETDLLKHGFTMKELNIAINTMKNGKSPGEDGLFTEQIKQFGKETKTWLLKFFNNCLATYTIPKMWRRAKVVAILKPGKDPDLPSSYRPISLLCHLFKLYERLILQRIQTHVDTFLIPQQAGFRPGKSCTGQVLSLTEHIEEGFQKKLTTGVVLIDLTAAYDTVNHKKLLQKVYSTTKDFRLMQVIGSLLQNRRFYVELQGKKSRWRLQKSGLPQGSVLAPTLFNIYTNDQPVTEHARHFLYADDLAISIQDRTFRDIEVKLEAALKTMSTYYRENALKPNPAKTQVCAFHLNTHKANKKLKISWEGEELVHADTPKYLGVTMDRTLSFKQHCHNTRQKVTARNNLIKKLAGSKWGAKPQVLRTSAQALCFSTGEYAAPVWCRSKHAKQVDVALNQTCRIITGCMKATPLEKLYRAAGFSTPTERRKGIEHVEKFKQVFDERHILHGNKEPMRRLKSRNSFLQSAPLDPPDNFPQSELPSSGSTLDWKTWKTLNRIRTGVAPVKTNMIRWGIQEDQSNLCECGEVQDEDHILRCILCPATCSIDDMWIANDNAINVARYWAEKF